MLFVQIKIKAVINMPTFDELPPHLKNVLEFTRKFIEEKSYAPTVRDIGAAIGVSSTSMVHGYIKSLEDAGFIRRNAAISRGIVLAINTKEAGTALSEGSDACSVCSGNDNLGLLKERPIPPHARSCH